MAKYAWCAAYKLVLSLLHLWSKSSFNRIKKFGNPIYSISQTLQDGKRYCCVRFLFELDICALASFTRAIEACSVSVCNAEFIMIRIRCNSCNSILREMGYALLLRSSRFNLTRFTKRPKYYSVRQKFFLISHVVFFTYYIYCKYWAYREKV